MKLRLTNHFRYRMEERGISIDHVKKAMLGPDKTESCGEGKKVARKLIEGKVLEVVYFKEAFRDKKDEYVIVTAYYLEE